LATFKPDIHDLHEANVAKELVVSISVAASVGVDNEGIVPTS